MYKVIASPERYVQGPGEMGNIAQYVTALECKTAYAIVDPFIFDNYELLMVSYKVPAIIQFISKYAL